MTSSASQRGIDATALEAWFRRQLPNSVPPLRFELIAGGHSNLTYRVTDTAGRRFALRRPPLGDLPPGAHDVLREARILTALQGSAVPVPQVVGTCADISIISAPFYVMDWVDGPVLDRLDRLDAILPDSQSRRAAAFGLIDTLAALHQVDIEAVGLTDLGPHENYLQRQLDRMQRVWERAKTRELPIIDALYKRLRANCPPQHRTGLVHSDFRFGNVILRDDGTPAAVLDWELCAVGDVLADLGCLLANWDLPEDTWENVWMEVPPTRGGGFPTRAELVTRYAAVTGYSVHDIDYYRAFSLWRIAIIAEGIKRRYASGAMGAQAADPLLLDRRVRDRAALADQFFLKWKPEL